MPQAGALSRIAPPFAGMTRIRFDGCDLSRVARGTPVPRVYAQRGHRARPRFTAALRERTHNPRCGWECVSSRPAEIRRDSDAQASATSARRRLPRRGSRYRRQGEHRRHGVSDGDDHSHRLQADVRLDRGRRCRRFQQRRHGRPHRRLQVDDGNALRSRASARASGGTERELHLLEHGQVQFLRSREQGEGLPRHGHRRDGPRVQHHGLAEGGRLRSQDDPGGDARKPASGAVAPGSRARRRPRSRPSRRPRAECSATWRSLRCRRPTR